MSASYPVAIVATEADLSPGVAAALQAARAVLIDNGDWDGGLADLSGPGADDIPTWLIRGDPTAGDANDYQL